MPDIGGFGKGLLKGALSATEKAADRVKDAAEAATRKLAADDADTTQTTSTDDDAEITQVISDTTARGHQPPVPSAAGANAPHQAGHVPPAAGGGRVGQLPGNAEFARPAPGHQPPRPPAPGTRPQGPMPGRPAPGYPPAGGPGQQQAGFGSPPPGRTTGPWPATPPAPHPSGFRGPVPNPGTPGFGGAAPVPNSPRPGGPAPAPPGGAAFADPGVDAADEPTLADEPAEQADPAEVNELVEMFQRLLARKRPPAGPIQDEWSIGVGDLLAEHPRVPKKIRGIVSKLNRFGGLTYSPQEIVFDGDDVQWEKVSEVRTRHVVDYLIGDAVEQQIENLPLPWFPGRKRLVDALGQAILTVTIATAKNELEKLDLDLRIPAEIAYKASFGRTKELSAGVLSAIVLADPAVNASVIATAQARGIPIVEDDDELLADASERAEKIREKIAALEKELDKFTKRFGRSG